MLADRDIFTALARAGVSGVDPAWLRSLYGFAIAPHLVLYLKIDVDSLIQRVLGSGGMDYWESGMDLKFGDDIYDNFRAYQGKLMRENNSLAHELDFHVVDARRSISTIQNQLCRQIEQFLGVATLPVTLLKGPRRSWTLV